MVRENNLVYDNESNLIKLLIFILINYRDLGNAIPLWVPVICGCFASSSWSGIFGWSDDPFGMLTDLYCVYKN